MGNPNKKDKPKPSWQAVVEPWLELDLTAVAKEGALAPAFEVEDSLLQLTDILTSGRCPVLVGERGVGKTAIVHELVRRCVAGADETLAQRTVLQLSLRRRAGTLKEPGEQMRPALQKLQSALARQPEPIVLFFSDLELAYGYDLELPFLSLAHRIPGRLICEGQRSGIKAMMESTPGIESQFLLLPIEEPDPPRMARVLNAWAADQESRGLSRVEPGALDEALHLTNRFLTRGHMPRKAMDLLNQVITIRGRGAAVRQRDIIDRFCQQHRVRTALIDPHERFDLTGFEADLNRRILGQPSAIRAVVQMIGLIKAGLVDLRRPIGVYLFVGPTGVGKTHVAQLLAEFIFGSRERMIRFNMADYQQPDAAPVLFGDPTQYNPSVRQGVLTRSVMGHPFAVLLFDELEKAHRSIHDRLLQLIDEGSFVNGHGETISCRSSILIATSNAGAEIFRGQSFGFVGRRDSAARDQELDRRLEDYFRFEFLNRFDQIVRFYPLSRSDIRTIALRELEMIQNRPGFRQRGIDLEIDESVLDWVAANGYDPDYGARFLRRTIERHVTTELAETIVRESPPPGAGVQLTVRGNAIRARVQRAAPPPKSGAVLADPSKRTVPDADLQRDAAALVARARPRLDAYAQRTREREALLAQMNEPGFWDDRERRGPILDQFRALDVAVRAEERLARPILGLSEALQDDGVASERAAGLLASAARAMSEWEERIAEEGPSAIWLIISNADPSHTASDWLGHLVRMEIAWARRQHLTAEIVAYEATDETTQRVLLSIEGPGTTYYFAMEAGIHRLVRRGKRDSRARMTLLPKSASDTTANRQRVVAVPPRSGLFGLAISCTGHVELPQRGMRIELLGANAELLAIAAADIAAQWQPVPVDSDPVARIYGETDGTVRDPRTDASAPRLRGVLRGELERFHEAWRAQAERTAPDPTSSTA